MGKLKLKRREAAEESCRKALSAGFTWVPLNLLSLLTSLPQLSLN